MLNFSGAGPPELLDGSRTGLVAEARRKFLPFLRTEALFEERKTNKIQQLDVYYNLLSQHVSGIVMPIFS
jgi:hypothetical protein